MHRANDMLRAAMTATSDPYVLGWVDHVGRIDGDVLAATPPVLYAPDASLCDDRLLMLPFVPRVTPAVTPPYVFPRNGVPPPGFAPQSVADLLEPEGHARLCAWENDHWPYLVDCLRRGTAAERRANDTCVIPQSMFRPEARGVVWDTTGPHPVPADFDAPIHSGWNRALLAQLLADYPDKELLSLVQFGAAGKSDAVGLDLVLSPHLVSLCKDFPKVAASIRDMESRGWCSVFNLIPSIPARGPPRGTTPKGRDGLDVRVTTDGGAPRKPTNPPSISLNTASRAATWPKEVKPTLADAAQDLAVLRHIADRLGEEVYVLADDYKSFFNQFATHPSEWWKSCFLWLRSDGAAAAPAWVREHVLGFGLSPSSNIAQRFADAMLWVLEQRVDAAESALSDIDDDPVLRAILAARKALGPHQDRLWSCFVYTDDTIFLIVGAARTVRVLGAWGDLTRDVRTLMAGESKRQAGNRIP
jgi:hypothetical protein